MKFERHVSLWDSLAEWSKALDLGSSPKGRGFKSHSCQAFCCCFLFAVLPFFRLLERLLELEEGIDIVYKQEYASKEFSDCAKRFVVKFSVLFQGFVSSKEIYVAQMGSFDLSNENKCKTSPKFLLNQTRCLLQKKAKEF